MYDAKGLCVPFEQSTSLQDGDKANWTAWLNVSCGRGRENAGWKRKQRALTASSSGDRFSGSPLHDAQNEVC